MKQLAFITLFILVSACSAPEVKEHKRTVKSLKSGRIYQRIIHDMQEKGDIIKIDDPLTTLIDNKEGMAYDSVIVMDDAPRKD
jgi:hypothetical protein